MNRVKLLILLVLLAIMLVSIGQVAFSEWTKRGAYLCYCYETPCGTLGDLLNPIGIGVSGTCIECICVRNPDLFWGGLYVIP